MPPATSETHGDRARRQDPIPLRDLTRRAAGGTPPGPPECAEPRASRAWRTPRGQAGPLGALTGLLVPLHCPGCGRPEVRICDECSAPWWQAPLRSESAAPRLDVRLGVPLPVWAIVELEGCTHGALVAWKDHGRRDLDGFFADAMARAAEQLAPALALGELAVVPVPSRRASLRRRGIDLPAMLADAAVAGLTAGGVRARVVEALAVGGAEQRGQGASARLRQASQVRLRPSGLPVAQRPLAALLVDDVVTTGASLAAAMRALGVTFLTPCAGLALASVPSAGAHAAGGLR